MLQSLNKSNQMRKIFFNVLFFILLATNSLASPYSWVEIGEDSKLIARTISKQQECPEINLDGKSFKMNLRTSLNDQYLNETVFICEYDVTNHQKVSINNQSLKTIPSKVKRFVIVGDTGCENAVFDKAHQNQKCDPEGWPFQKIMDKIITLNPDFIIHTGDMIYQMDKKNNTGKSWFFFQEDFFKPAQNILNKAPFIFVRGNHERCAIGGEGWFAFFDVHEYSKCTDFTKPYQIKINDLNFIVFDSSGSATGKDYPKEQLSLYSNEFNEIYSKINSKHWLLIHHPIIPLELLSKEEGFSPKMHAMVLKDSFKMEYSNKINNVFSGHYHVNSLIKNEKHNLTQTIIGNSGTLLHRSSKNKYTARFGDNKMITNIRYGYTLFERLENNLWKATSYDIDGNAFLITNYSTK